MTLNTEDIRYECGLHPCNPLNNLLFDASREIDRLRGLLKSRIQWTHDAKTDKWTGSLPDGSWASIITYDDPWDFRHTGILHNRERLKALIVVHGDDVNEIKRALEAVVNR